MGKGDPRTEPDRPEPRSLPQEVSAALALVDRVFGSFSSPDETGACTATAPKRSPTCADPGPRSPDRLLGFLVNAHPGHFRDYPAVARRLMPQMLRALADETLPWIDETFFALARPELDWHSWPTEQVTAVVSFIDAWWAASLREPADDPAWILGIIAAIGLDVNDYLARWESGPVPDQHLVELAEGEVLQLLEGSTFALLDENERTRKATASLCGWLADTGTARLELLGERELAENCALLALPLSDRMHRLCGTIPQP